MCILHTDVGANYKKLVGGGSLGDLSTALVLVVLFYVYGMIK